MIVVMSLLLILPEPVVRLFVSDVGIAQDLVMLAVPALQ
jgi:Na+-driven multidrug efflux pump